MATYNNITDVTAINTCPHTNKLHLFFPSTIENAKEDTKNNKLECSTFSDFFPQEN